MIFLSIDICLDQEESSVDQATVQQDIVSLETQSEQAECSHQSSDGRRDQILDTAQARYASTLRLPRWWETIDILLNLIE